jgi:hypothetical protein
MALEGIVSPDWLKMKTPQRRPEALADTPGAGGAGDLGEDGGVNAGGPWGPWGAL